MDARQKKLGTFSPLTDFSSRNIEALSDALNNRGTNYVSPLSDCLALHFLNAVVTAIKTQFIGLCVPVRNIFGLLRFGGDRVQVCCRFGCVILDEGLRCNISVKSRRYCLLLLAIPASYIMYYIIMLCLK